MPSLCETCGNVREICTARSRFLLCELSFTNAAYPKYPPQPVVRCSGYQPKDTAWVLEMPLRPDQPVASPPAGITIRGYRPGADDRAVHRVIDDAFSEWPDREPRPFEEWVPFSIGRETFSPELSALALDGDRIVGAAIVLDYDNADDGYVHQLAVHREYRHRGIARALLHRAFAGFARTGRHWCTLSTNSYTGALSLYERVGMRIRHSYTHYAKELGRP